MTNIFVSQIILHFGYARVFMFSSVLLGTSTVLLMTIIRVFNFSCNAISCLYACSEYTRRKKVKVQ